MEIKEGQGKIGTASLNKTWTTMKCYENKKCDNPKNWKKWTRDYKLMNLKWTKWTPNIELKSINIMNVRSMLACFFYGISS